MNKGQMEIFDEKQTVKKMVLVQIPRQIEKVVGLLSDNP